MRILWLTLALSACTLYFGDPKKEPRRDDPAPDAGVITFDAYVPDGTCGGGKDGGFDPPPDAQVYYPDADISPDGGCEGFPDAGLDVDAGYIPPPDAP